MGGCACWHPIVLEMRWETRGLVGPWLVPGAQVGGLDRSGSRRKADRYVQAEASCSVFGDPVELHLQFPLGLMVAI